MKFGFNRPSGFRGEDVWNCWQHTHTHTHTHTYTHTYGRQAYLYHKLTNEPKGTGELQICLFYVTADILTNKLQKCSLSTPLTNIWILSKPLNCLRKKQYSKIISSEAIRGMKLQLCGNVHNISLYNVFFFLLLLFFFFFFFLFYFRCSCAFVALAT